MVKRVMESMYCPRCDKVKDNDCFGIDEKRTTWGLYPYCDDCYDEEVDVKKSITIVQTNIKALRESLGSRNTTTVSYQETEKDIKVLESKLEELCLKLAGFRAKEDINRGKRDKYLEENYDGVISVSQRKGRKLKETDKRKFRGCTIISSNQSQSNDWIEIKIPRKLEHGVRVLMSSMGY